MKIRGENIQLPEDPPPPYSSIEIQASPSSPLLPSPQTVPPQSAPLPRIAQFPVVIFRPIRVTRNNYEEDSYTFNCCIAPFELVTWGALIYQLVVGVVIGLLGFLWILASLIVSIVCLIIPPIGLLLLGLSCCSYRMLGRLELILLELCMGRPEDFAHHSYPRVFFTDSPRESNLISDIWTWRCVVYYLLMKPVISLSTLLMTVIVLSVSIPIICCLPIGLVFIRNMGVWQRDIAFGFLM
ncbi:uncharacterized protein VTP21DRAFT_5612 [Calcarisporiella thermophila]|uniref:uncharacterized protein n=1 Tax=Calcarisporiella thermophila TaxID=911321 RepID=UPI003743EA32